MCLAVLAQYRCISDNRTELIKQYCALVLHMSFCSGIHTLSAGLLQLSTDCISDTASISRKYTAVVSVARLARLHLHRPHWPPDVSRLFL